MLNTKTIGNKIAEARKNTHLSQAELAAHLFISSQAVGKWERGESMPDIVTFNRLAEILGVDLNYFSEDFPSATPETAAAVSGEETAKKLSWNMSRGNWTDADFSGLKNLHEKFSSSNLQRCLFRGSDLSGLLLKSNHVEDCDFSDSNIGHSQIKSSYLGNNLLKHCSLKETEFNSSHIEGCNLSGADFTGVVAKSCDFSKNKMVDTVWNRTAFIATQLTELVFEGTMEGCSFENCDFKKVTFQNTTMINTFFKGSRLKRIRFVDCKADNITYAFLKNGKADLTGITLLQPSAQDSPE